MLSIFSFCSILSLVAVGSAEDTVKVAAIYAQTGGVAVKPYDIEELSRVLDATIQQDK